MVTKTCSQLEIKVSFCLHVCAFSLLDLELATARKRRYWVRDWILRRPENNLLYEEIELEDEGKYKQAFRMSSALFERLLSFIRDDIKKQVYIISYGCIYIYIYVCVCVWSVCSSVMYDKDLKLVHFINSWC